MPEVEGKWTYRVSMTSTIKEGYRVGDASVSYADIEGLPGDMPSTEIKKRLYALVKDGEAVAEQLNSDRTQAHALMQKEQ